MSKAEILMAVIAAITATLTALTLLWLLMGSPAPLSATNLRRPIKFVKRWHTAHKSLRVQKQWARQETIAEDRKQQIRDALGSASQQLRDMRHEETRYLSTEFKRQARTCKKLALDYLLMLGVDSSQMLSGKYWMIMRYDDYSIVIDIRHMRDEPEGKNYLKIDWYSDPQLTDMFRFCKSIYYSREVLVNELLTDEDIQGDQLPEPPPEQ